MSTTNKPLDPKKLEASILHDLGMHYLNDVTRIDNDVREFIIRAADIFEITMDKYRNRGEKMLPLKSHSINLLKRVGDDCIKFQLSPVEVQAIFSKMIYPYIHGAYFLDHETKKRKDLFKVEEKIEEFHFSRTRMRNDGAKTIDWNAPDSSWRPRIPPQNYSAERSDVEQVSTITSVMKDTELRHTIISDLDLLIPSGKIDATGKKKIEKAAEDFSAIVNKYNAAGQTIAKADKETLRKLKKVAGICDNGNFEKVNIITIFDKAINIHILMALPKNGSIYPHIKDLNDYIKDKKGETEMAARENGKWSGNKPGNGNGPYTQNRR